jgi:hypothetical protein
MRTSLPLLFTLLLHGCLAGACSGEAFEADTNPPQTPSVPEGARVVDFEAAAAGAPPEGFTFARTGPGDEGRWVVAEVAGAPSGRQALSQTSTDRTGSRFPLAIYEGFTGRDVDVSVRFMPVSGEVDQAAGLVWRYRDPNHYYLVRANALEDNVVLYKVENGKRTDLPVKGAGRTYGVKQKVPGKSWSELRVTTRGNLFTVSFDGKQIFQVEDSTFPGAGKVGLWTKADSVTHFDDLRIAGLDESGR